MLSAAKATPEYGEKQQQVLLAKKQLRTCSTLFLYISLPLFCTTATWNSARNILVIRFMEEMSSVYTFTLFSLHSFSPCMYWWPLEFLILSPPLRNFLCCSSNKKMSPLFFISRSRSLLSFFYLSFAGLPPTFSFSLSFSCSIFQIWGHDN